MVVKSNLKKIFFQLVIILGTLFIISYLWEFYIEDWLQVETMGADESENSAERWEFIITSMTFSFIALIFPLYKIWKMLNQLEKSKLKLEHANEYLEVNVKERTEEILIAQKEAEKANKAKSEFLSRMSHELRTPMNAVLGFAQLLEMEHDPLSTTQRGNVQEILNAGQHLMNLINEVLDLSRIESGQLSVSLEPVNIHSTLEKALPIVGPLAKKSNIRIINNIFDKKNETIFADSIRLKQVFINLIGNAIKYNKENGSVTLDSYGSSSQFMKITIRDTGRGIPKEQQEKVYQNKCVNGIFVFSYFPRSRPVARHWGRA